jgi:hypothetical protein
MRLICYDPETGENRQIDPGPVSWLFIEDEQFYVLDLKVDESVDLYVMDPDGSNRRSIPTPDARWSWVYDGYYYFDNPAAEEKLFRMDVETGQSELVYDAGVIWSTAYEDKLYISEWDSVSGSILTTALDGSGAEQFVSGIVSSLTVSAHGVFYTDIFGRPAWVSLDGDQKLVLSQNHADYLNLAGGWVFYSNLNDDDRIWMVRPDGSHDHPFVPPA